MNNGVREPRGYPAKEDCVPTTYPLERLDQSNSKWERSPGLRAVYGEWYRRIQDQMVQGRALELGSGIGKAGMFISGLCTSDVRKTRFVEREVDAYRIRQQAGVWRNIVAVDMLHHLRYPMDFLASASRALEPG